jgi:hypothetical protein
MKIRMMNTYYDDPPWQSRAEIESLIQDADQPPSGNEGARSTGVGNESMLADSIDE